MIWVKASAMSRARGPLGGYPQVAAALAVDDPPGGVQDPVAQSFPPFCEVAVEGEEAEAGEQVTSDGRGLAPGFVDLVVPGGRCRTPVALARRIRSSTHVWVRCRASRNGPCPPGVLVEVTWCLLPSCCSNSDSWAPGCGFSRRIRIRMPGGHFANRSPPAEWRSIPPYDP